MRRALESAARGRGAVEPNPMVGAVIVRDGELLAEGWHRRFGGPHAEAEALTAARSAGADVRGATVYVTLEPCVAFPGKRTPACSEALIEAGVGRVVVAMADPHPQVAGKGIGRLQAAGVHVDVGICEPEAWALLAPYTKLTTRGRPWVICKWAQTRDGYLALPDDRWVTGEPARRRVHEIRAFCDAVLAGIGTVLADDPLLTNRSGAGRQPARVVLDSHLRTPPDSQLAATAGEHSLIVVAAEGATDTAPEAADALRKAGGHILELPAGSGGVSLAALLDELGERGWTNLLVEGGPKVLASFLRQGLADELDVFISPDYAGVTPEIRGGTPGLSRRVPAGDSGSTLPRFDIADVPTAEAMAPEIEQLGRDEMRRYVLATPGPPHDE